MSNEHIQRPTVLLCVASPGTGTTGSRLGEPERTAREHRLTDRDIVTGLVDEFSRVRSTSRDPHELLHDQQEGLCAGAFVGRVRGFLLCGGGIVPSWRMDVRVVQVGTAI